MNSLIMFAFPISIPRFKSFIFHQNSPKIKLFLKKKCKILKRWGLRPQTPITASQLRISGYALVALCAINNHMRFLSICFEQFFLHRSVANLIMLAIDVCLIVFCLKSFVCITHCVTLIPSCYIALNYLFAKV